jgi:hypothetical protein
MMKLTVNNLTVGQHRDLCALVRKWAKEERAIVTESTDGSGYAFELLTLEDF